MAIPFELIFCVLERKLFIMQIFCISLSFLFYSCKITQNVLPHAKDTC